MKKDPNFVPTHELIMSEGEFLDSFNANMPAGYPHITLELMKRFKLSHPALFKAPNAWSLDLHRKRMIEWLPRNI